MAPQSSTLAWKIPWKEEPGGLQSMGSLRVGHYWVTSLSLWCIGEGKGNPLQCSCLENPRDGGAWWAPKYGVAQSWTRLKWLGAAATLAAAHTFIFGFLRRTYVSSTLFSSVSQWCPTLSDPMDCGNRGSLSITKSQTLFNLMIRSWSSNLDPQTLLIFYTWKYVTFKKSLPICPTLQSWAIIFLVWVPSFFFWNSL